MKFARLTLIAAATAVSIYFVAAPQKQVSLVPSPEQQALVAVQGLPLDTAQPAAPTYRVVFEPVTIIGRAHPRNRR